MVCSSESGILIVTSLILSPSGGRQTTDDRRQTTDQNLPAACWPVWDIWILVICACPARDLLVDFVVRVSIFVFTFFGRRAKNAAPLQLGEPARLSRNFAIFMSPELR